jgi:hypothetical protein
MHCRRRNRPTLLTRSTALLAVLVVLALAVLVASPELHERLHAHDAPPAAGMDHHGDRVADTDDGCVVTLFAQGILGALALFALVFTGHKVRTPSFAWVAQLLPDAPPYRLLPTQAPPAA